MAQRAYNNGMAASGFGTGGKYQQAIQAATAAVQGLAGGNLSAALAGGAAPYLAEVVKTMTTDPVTGEVNKAANVAAHAVVNAALAVAQGNNALAGAAGAATGEMVGMIATQMYGKPVNELSETEKQTVSTLATVAAGLAGGLVGDSGASAVAGAQSGKTTVENNSLSKDKPSIFDINPMLKMGVVDENGDLLKGGGGIAKGGNRAVSSLEGAKLKEYYRQAEKYGQAGVKALENGNYRFYGDMTPSRTTGEMAGARLVREWDPKTGQTRTWYETLDHAGNIRSVAPKPVTNDKNHHIFDADGNYQGRR